MNYLIAAFALSLSRVSGLFVSAPILSMGAISPQIRGAIVGVLAIAMVPAVSGQFAFEVGPLALVNEFLIGLALGTVVRVSTAAIELAGEAAGMQMGFGFARTVSTLTEDQVGPLTSALSVYTALIFFAAELHLVLLRALAESFQRFPPGDFSFAGWVDAVVRGGGELFVVGLRIAAPIIFVGFASQATAALLTKVAPQLNLWAIGFMVTIGAGLVALALYAPVLAGQIEMNLRDGIESFAEGVGL